MTTNVLSKGDLLGAKLKTEIFNKVKGHSTLARLSGQEPIPFNGSKEFIFSMDKEIDIVAENGAKSHGGVTLAPVVMVPIKVEYGARVSDEFMYASEEEAIDIMKSWTDGFAMKMAKGFDLMGIHGVNPRTGEVAQLIGTNSFDTNEDVNVIEYDADDLEGNLDDAAAAIDEFDVTGWGFSKEFASALSKLKVNGVPQYPEFRFGANPGAFSGTNCDVNSTIGYGDEDMAITGDFANCFKWGIAKEFNLEVIEYGNPDNSDDGDLKGHNQVYLRSEAFIGWGILVPEAFSVVKVVDEP